MAFEKYFNKKAIAKYFITTKPNKNLKLSIVIPCFNEDNLIDTLSSVNNCNFDKNLFEIIVVVNHSVTDNQESKNTNYSTVKQISEYIRSNNLKNLHIIKAFDLEPKKSGVGYARKIGMDLSAQRFYEIQNSEGIIISLDADTLVEKNYLDEIQKKFKDKNIEGVSINFKHIINSNTEQNKAIALYEMYLRYFLVSMKLAGYKNVFHTIGSAFAVRASAYIKYGGMVNKKAGEDFYFINKISSNGNYAYLKDTCVYPSARISKRVPFGTGPEIEKIIKEKTYNVYDFNSFSDINYFINNFYKFYNIDKTDYNYLISELPENLSQFLDKNNFYNNISKISKNCTNISCFEKAFFKWFSVFKVIQFLNFSHTTKYKKQEVVSQVKKLLTSINKPVNDNVFDLLNIIRSVDLNLN